MVLRMAGSWLPWAVEWGWLADRCPWGAPSWFQLDGRQLEDFHWDKHGRERPLVAERQARLAMLFVGGASTP